MMRAIHPSAVVEDGARLGAGVEISANDVPGVSLQTGVEPAVQGDRIFRWLENPARSGATSYILVGFKDGKVWRKHYWSYSL